MTFIRKYLLVITVVWFMAGSITFTVWPDYDMKIWNSAYFIWDAARDLLITLTLFDLIPKTQRWLLKPPIIYLIIRLIWEVINSVVVIGSHRDKIESTGFLVLSVGLALLLLRDLVKRWQQNY